MTLAGLYCGKARLSLQSVVAVIVNASGQSSAKLPTDSSPIQAAPDLYTPYISTCPDTIHIAHVDRLPREHSICSPCDKFQDTPVRSIGVQG